MGPPITEWPQRRVAHDHPGWNPASMAPRVLSMTAWRRRRPPKLHQRGTGAMASVGEVVPDFSKTDQIPGSVVGLDFDCDPVLADTVVMLLFGESS